AQDRVLALYFFAASLGGRQRQPAPDRKEFDVEAMADIAPNSRGRLEHDDDGDRAHQDQIIGAVVGQELAQDDKDQHADEGAPERADAADDHHENHHHGPIVDAEPCLRRYAQLLQEDHSAD